MLDIRNNGFHLICIRTADKRNPYRVYMVWYGHRRQIAKYGDFLSVIIMIGDLYKEGADTFAVPELIEWAKKRGNI